MITTEDDYIQSLERVAFLLSLPENSLDEVQEKELDDLTDEVEAYEKIHYPMKGD